MPRVALIAPRAMTAPGADIRRPANAMHVNGFQESWVKTGFHASGMAKNGRSRWGAQPRAESDYIPYCLARAAAVGRASYVSPCGPTNFSPTLRMGTSVRTPLEF